MNDVPPELLRRLQVHRQEHVLYDWHKLDAHQQNELVATLSMLDFDELHLLRQQLDTPNLTIPSSEIGPLPVSPASVTDTERLLGQESLSRGEVAALVVAGGQGSRLGFDKPKGLFPVGPVSGASLFQIHAEKVLALGKRYSKPIPFLVMTSPATDADTRAFFQENRYFGLHHSDVIFFQQGTMPAVCLQTGRLLLEGPGKLFLSPNGHGGTLTALAECGILDELRSRRIRHLFYFQVDNPLVRVCDPGFLGRHIATRSEASSKVVFKRTPEERVGVFALIDGKCGLIEYSDLPQELAKKREPDGQLCYRAGNPAIHLFTLEFLERVISTGGLPYHMARKAVTHYDPVGETFVQATNEPNALKFERFIFDALPLAQRWLAMETHRENEFAPLKNANGPDSPEAVRTAQIELHARWLVSKGIPTHGHPVEISPLFAMEAEELAQKLPRNFTVTGPTVLREESMDSPMSAQVRRSK
jgi:UDP-N-acetylglucosamine/UDP-N-acetylgalactosamine diphosphorylase